MWIVYQYKVVQCSLHIADKLGDKDLLLPGYIFFFASHGFTKMWYRSSNTSSSLKIASPTS